MLVEASGRKYSCGANPDDNKPILPASGNPALKQARAKPKLQFKIRTGVQGRERRQLAGNNSHHSSLRRWQLRAPNPTRKGPPIQVNLSAHGALVLQSRNAFSAIPFAWKNERALHERATDGVLIEPYLSPRANTLPQRASHYDCTFHRSQTAGKKNGLGKTSL